MTMSYEEQFFKQALHCSNKSSSGFAVLLGLVGIVLFGIYQLIKFIVKGVSKMLLEREEQNLQREVHRRAVTRFLQLLSATNYTLQWNAVKSHTNRSTAELTQWVNFVAFDEENKSLSIINSLVNEVMYDTLTIVSNKEKDRDLVGTIVVKNGDILKIQEELKNITGSYIKFKNF